MLVFVVVLSALVCAACFRWFAASKNGCLRLIVASIFTVAVFIFGGALAYLLVS